MRFERLVLNLLVALDALIEDRSVSTAARLPCLSQPPLSGAHSIARETIFATSELQWLIAHLRKHAQRKCGPVSAG